MHFSDLPEINEIRVIRPCLHIYELGLHHVMQPVLEVNVPSQVDREQGEHHHEEHHDQSAEASVWTVQMSVVQSSTFPVAYHVALHPWVFLYETLDSFFIALLFAYLRVLQLSLHFLLVLAAE